MLQTLRVGKGYGFKCSANALISSAIVSCEKKIYVNKFMFLNGDFLSLK